MVNRRPRRVNKRHRPKAEAEAAETGGEMNDSAEQDEWRWIMLKNNGRVKRAGRTDAEHPLTVWIWADQQTATSSE